jgi:hypothetical protein
MSQHNSSAAESSSSSTSSTVSTALQSSTSSTASTTPSSKESTSDPSSSSSEILQQQSFIQKVPLRTKDDVKQALSPALGRPKEFLLDGIGFDDELIWLLFGAKLERLFLKKCTFDSCNSFRINDILEFLKHGHPLKSCFKFAVQFNDCTTEWILCDEFSNAESLEHERINSLIFMLPGNIPQPSLLNDISSLVFIPLNLDSTRPPSFQSKQNLSSQSKQNLKSIVNHYCPNLKHLLFIGIDFDDNLEDYIPISTLRLGLIHIWNCDFKTTDVIWSTLVRSTKLVNSMHTRKVQGFQFYIPINGHTTQIVYSDDLFFFMPNSPELIHGLILLLGQELPNDLLLDNISFLILHPSKLGLLEALSPQSKQTLKPMMNRLCPKLKYLLLMHINFDGNIEDYIPFPQSKLDFIYIWNCSFEVIDPIWFTLGTSLKLLNSIPARKIQCYQFDIPINGHITQIVYNSDPFLFMPNSPELVHGLIFLLGQELPNDLLLDNVSFLALHPSKLGLIETLSPQAKQTLKPLMNRLCSKLKYLLLMRINFDGNIEDYIPFLQSRLEFIYIWNCSLKAIDPIWLTLSTSMNLLNSMPPRKVQNFQFAIPINGHTTQIVYNYSRSFVMPNSPESIHGLILLINQELPNDLFLNNFSFLALSPSERGSITLLSSQSKKSLKPFMNRLHPKLKHLLLMNTIFNINIEDYVPILQLKLDFIYLWDCAFESDDPIWSVLCASRTLLSLGHAGKVQGFQFTIPIDGHTTQIVYNYARSFLMPNSPDLVHGLILPLNQVLPNDLFSKDFSFLALPPSKKSPITLQSSQSKQYLKSLMDRLHPKLKHLFLMHTDFASNIEDYVPILQLKLDFIYLWDCAFESDDPIWSTLYTSKNLIDSNSGKDQAFQFAIHLNGHITQIVINKSSSFLTPDSPDMVHGLMISYGQSFPSDPPLDDVSFLALFPSKANLIEVLPPQFKQGLKSFMNRLHPKLKHLLLINADFGDHIEDYIPISQLKLNLIYMWHCLFKTKDLIWLALIRSAELINSMRPVKVQSFQFAIPINGHITQVLYNFNPSFVKPNSPDLAYGLILPLGQEPPNDLFLDNISFLALPPSEMGPITVLSSQSKQSLKSLISRLHPKLQRIFLMHTDFNSNIEDYIPISRLKLDLIYFSNCLFETKDPIWAIFTRSVKLVDSLHPGKVQSFQFALPINGHTTQIVYDTNLSFPMPNSPNLGHGLISSLGEDLSNNLLFDDISFLALFSSKMNLQEVLSPQSKQILRFSMNCLHPKLTHLLLEDINFDGNIEDYVPFSRLKLDLIYIWGCTFKTDNLIWLALIRSVKLVDSMHGGRIKGFQFSIPINEHITQIVHNTGSSFVMPNVSDLVYGLILHLGQNLSYDLLSNNISFLVFLPSSVNLSGQHLYSQFKQSLESIKSRCPKLKHLFLQDVSIDGVEGMPSLIRQLELEVSTL